MQFILFLRGINVGGKQVKMSVLKKILEENGFKNIKTILASGNVIFETENNNIPKLKLKVEDILHNSYTFSIQSIILSSEEFKDIYNQSPFKNISQKSEKKFYVSLFQEKPIIKISLPFKMENFSILSMLHNCIYSTVVLSKNFGTVDAMEILEREFGKNITTRNWNTIEKIYSSLI